MGYDVHITRKKNWWNEDGPAISMQEWESLVANDPEMRMDGYAEATVGNDKILRFENEGLSVWTAYSAHGKDGNMAWFNFSVGEKKVKNPATEILK